MLLLASCTELPVPGQTAAGAKVLLVFLKSGTADSLTAYQAPGIDGGTAEKIEHILGILSHGVENSGTRPTLGEHVEVLRVVLDGSHVKLYFTKDYENQSRADEMVCRASIVRSLTVLEEVDTVSFLVDGVPLKNPGGGIVGPMDGSSIVLDFNELASSSRTWVLTLYYPSAASAGLKRIVLRTRIEQDMTVEEKVVDMLLHPPKGMDVTSYMSPDMTIKSVVTAGGICYLDVGSSFRTDHPGGSYAEKMTVYSIVNSLTELPSVQQVQFMVDGHIVKRFKGSVDFSKLFDRNLNYVID